MKNHLKHHIEDVSGHFRKICIVREYLQARILQGFQEDGVYMRWAFLGGTALRFLYSIPRFSEDLDFSVIESCKVTGFRSALQRVQSNLEPEGYHIRLKVNDSKRVSMAFFRFPALLYELGLSPREAQTISIKIELDTNPPGGAVTETTLIRRHVTINFLHYDRASLLAGKINAILSRPWTKGRDLYDLIWYLSDRTWPEPNLIWLNEALQQTAWPGPNITSRNWRDVLTDRLISLDWKNAQSDVAPFLERDRDIELVTLENVQKLLGGRL